MAFSDLQIPWRGKGGKMERETERVRDGMRLMVKGKKTTERDPDRQ